MTLSAHRNFIFVKPIVETGSKLILPPIFQRQLETVKRGIVRHAGPKACVSVGETIIFDKWQDYTVRIDNEDLIIIQTSHVIAVE